jgi:hypothetical protein
MMLPTRGLGDLLDGGALGALQQLDHQGLLGAGAGRGLVGRRGLARLGRIRLTPGRRGRAVGSGRRGRGIHRLDTGIGRRRARVGRGRALWRAVLGLDADGLEAGAGDAQRRRVVAARGAEVIDQALGLEAAEDLVDGAALDLERLGERQDGTVVALRDGAEDHGLGIAELRHGMISVRIAEAQGLLRPRAPAAAAARGGGGRSRASVFGDADPALEGLGPSNPGDAVAGLAPLVSGGVRLGLGREPQALAGAGGGDGVEGDHALLLLAGGAVTRHGRPH